MQQSRRNFIKSTAVLSAGLAFGMNAKSYGRIIGANDRLNFAIIGLNGRAGAHLKSIGTCSNVNISHVCDVDSQVLSKFSGSVKQQFGYSAVEIKDFRKILDDKNVDVITIATPEHWHTPMAVMGLKAGKHVFVEKPSSHNPREGEILVEAQKKYGKLVQLGNQQRSSDFTISIVEKIKNGLIGKPYFGKAWYCSQRKSIGVGKVIPVPDYLDWDLWQGPAPREDYKDNFHPYNWHWFQKWGTGEALNNGTHEIDICRWALGVDYPKSVNASGGRYHFKDDWQFYDTLVTNFEYDDKLITWEGMSCNSKQTYTGGRGSMIVGTEGTVIIHRRGYQVFDIGNKLLDELKLENENSTMDHLSADSSTDAHFKNFVNGIRNGEKLHSPISEGNISVTMLLLSNIAWKVNRTLSLDKENHRITNDAEAMKHWSREYEPGWELTI